MKILHLSTDDCKGGAARAAYRLHKGLHEAGHDSMMLVREKMGDDPAVIEATKANDETSHATDALLANAVQEFYLRRNRTELSNSLFSLGYPARDLRAQIRAIGPDVINLHWVTGFQSPPLIAELASGSTPVVWTLHDQFAFTGGCHYSMGCDGFTRDCASCPQLASDPAGVVPANLADKLQLFAGRKLTLVSPSEWLAACARRSAVFRGHRVETIPYGLETDVFCPLDKAEARRRLGVAEDALVVFFISEAHKEKRKGLALLHEAVALCTADAGIAEKIDRGKLCLLEAGKPHAGSGDNPFPTVSLGYIENDAALAKAYAAADVIAVPSIEDNFPNTVLEAMSCGRPVIGFESGGIVDMVNGAGAGKLAPAGDAAELACCLKWCFENPRELSAMGRRARAAVEQSYTLARQADCYSELYAELIASTPATQRRDGPQGEFSPDGIRPAVHAAVGPRLREVIDEAVYISSHRAAFACIAQHGNLRAAKQKLREQKEKLNAEMEAHRIPRRRFWTRFGSLLR